MRTILSIVEADFKECFRRFSFIAMIIVALYASFYFVPKSTIGGDITTTILIMPDTFFQADNPSWIPVASAWGLGITIFLVGFFYLRNMVAFDRTFGVDQLILTSPISTFIYLCGKVISGTLLLHCFIIATMLGSYFMTIWHFPGQHLSAYAFLSPYIFLFVSSVLVSAIAVAFGSIWFLRGGIGSCIFALGYFYVVNHMMHEGNTLPFLLKAFDISGSSLMLDFIENTVWVQSGLPLDTLLFALSVGTNYSTFSPNMSLVFDGMAIGTKEIAVFALTLVYAICLTFFATFFYRHQVKGINAHILKDMLKNYNMKKVSINTNSDSKIQPMYFGISPIKKKSWIYILFAELKLTLNSQTVMWKICFAVGMILCLFMDLEFVQTNFLPLFMLLGINIFSAMGTRDYQYKTTELIATTSSDNILKIIDIWISGLIVALIMVFPVILRMLLINQINGVLVALAGACFLPSLAVFLGEFTKVNRVFELIFAIITYGMLNNVGAFMYLGIHPEVCSLTRAGIYLAVGIVLGVSAVLKRKIV